MSATSVILAVLSPLLIALIRRQQWSETVITLFAILTVTALYVIGQAFDQTLAWPLPGGFWTGLMAAYGAQQLTYQALQAVPPGRSVIERLEAT